MKTTGTMTVTTPNDRQIVVTRVFDAPRTVVWDSMTKPELLKRWLAGPPGWTMVSCVNNLSVGGAYRWEWRGPDGAGMVMHGVYQEIVAPSRMVRSEFFQHGCNDQKGVQQGTLVLSEVDDETRTTLHLTLHFHSKQDRDATLASGMTHGMAEGYDRLDAVLTAIAAAQKSVQAA